MSDISARSSCKDGRQSDIHNRVAWIWLGDCKKEREKNEISVKLSISSPDSMRSGLTKRLVLP